MTKLATISIFSPDDRARPIADRRGGPVPALHETIVYTRPADRTLARCRVADVAWCYSPDGSTQISVFTARFLADRQGDGDVAGAGGVA